MPGTEDKQPEIYTKDKGSAQIHGQIFEYKFCALAYLRAKNRGYKFKLASNVKGLGAFDDVLVEYLDRNSRKSNIFVQLKSKLNKQITMSELKSKNGDFSLRKYYDSYIRVGEKFNCNEGVKMDGRIDENLFIIYTNTDVAQELKSKKVIESGEEEFLMAGGSVLQFNEEEHKAVYQHLQELPKHREFLSRLRIFHSQANEEEMELHIKRELQQNMNLPESELDLGYVCYRDFITDWWKNCNYFLKDTNCMQNDPLQKTSEKVRNTLIAKILDQRKSELADLSIKYKQSAITYLKQLTEPDRAVLIFAPGRSATLTAAKIHQMLCDTKHVILNLQQLIRYKSEVMVAWKSRFDVLVLESQKSTENLQDIFNEISIMLNERGGKKKFIFIANTMENIQQINDLRRTFSTKLREEYDDWKFTDILNESRKFFLEKEINFQGSVIQIKNIVKESDVRMFNALDCDSMSVLLANEKPVIGVPVANTLEYYVDRTLECKKYVKLGSQNEGELLIPFAEGALEELQSISTHRERNCYINDDEKDNLRLSLTNENDQEMMRVCKETKKLQYLCKQDEEHPSEQNTNVHDIEHRNFQRNITKVWRPNTLLDSEDRIILVTDEPGMGKSTLLTHLAKETKKHHPDVWIVRVNINNYTRILHDNKVNGFEEESAIKLITEAAQIKETEGAQLEKRLFNYTYNSTGNMVVLIDGVDEVSPHYTKEVVQIIGILAKTKIRKIWLTSRNSVKDQLEEEFQCRSYSLLPFSAEDQKSFLVKFWNQKYSNTKNDFAESLATRVVHLSFKHLSDEGKHFLGIPLQSLLLAEVFEENLKQCSTSATVELPENINLFMLYSLFVKKKWDIYLTDKKNSDRTNVNVLTDDEALYGIFIDNHKAAALMAILSTQHLEKLNEKKVLKKCSDFLQKIEQGFEKTGIITDVIDGRPVFLHRTFAEYFVASWLCDNKLASQIFMRDHLFESGFGVVRSMVDRILADKCPLHEAVLNTNMQHAAKLLKRKEYVTQKDRGGRTPLHVAVSCRNTELIRLILEHGSDVSSVDTLLGLSPVQYASKMVDWQMLSLMMDKRPEIREQILNEMNDVGTECIASALRAAARYGHTDLLRYLLSRGHHVNVALPGDSGTLLHEAARGNHIQTVRTLVELGARCDIQDANGRTALHVSAETGSVDVAKFIVERQEVYNGEAGMKYTVTLDRAGTIINRLNVHDKDGNTPLHLAAAAGNTSTVRYLFRAGSDVRICNTCGEYPLTMAARYGRNDTVMLLLQICPAAICEEIMTSALRAAIVAGQVDTTAILLRSGAAVSGGENEKPIHVASRMGHKEIVSLLLQCGASLTSRTDSGYTALHLASESGHLSLVKYLVEIARKGLESQIYDYETPLHLAARSGNIYLLKYLIENGCNINSASANGATCLHIACEIGHYTAVESLLKHGAEVNAVNSADQTPLHIAASRGQTKIVELLFLNKANFLLRDKDGITALLAASINGHQETVKFIVQHGGNIEDTDGKGNTIAHFAVANERYEILNFLSQQNVSLDVQNSDGRTALWVAAKRGHKSIIRFLLENGCYANIPDCEGVTPVTIAARECHWNAVNEFLNHDPRIRPEDAEHLNNQLHKLSESGNAEGVGIVLKCGINVNTTNEIDATPLHVAAKTGHEGVCQMLLENGASVNVADKAGDTPLILAAANGHEEVVRKLFNRCAIVDIANKNGLTPLIAAAIFGNVKVVRCLLNNCANVDMADNEGSTPLYVAAQEGHLEVVQELLNRGADVDGANNKFWTPLYTAAHKGHLEVVRELLNHGSRVEHAAKGGPKNFLRKFFNRSSGVHFADKGEFSPLYTVSSQGHVEIVRELLSHGARMNIANENGWTPIHEAAMYGHVEVVREFLNRGFRMDIENKDGWTPIYAAAREGHVEVVRELLNRGARLDIADKNGCTPIHVAALYGHVKVVRVLLKHGARMDIANKSGCTPIDAAADKGHMEVIRELLNRGARMNIADENGCTPIYAAAKEGHVEVVRELLNRGARMDNKNIYGWTPIYAAAEEGHVDIVRELLNHGAKMDIADKNGCTSIYAAASEGHVEVVRELLKRGGRMDIENKDGCTPIYAAADKGHVDVVRELLNLGARMDNKNIHGWTPIHAAAEEGHVDVVRELLNRGARMDIADKNGCTPIHAAAKEGHVEVVIELLNRGAGMDIVNEFGWTPVYVAAEEGHMEVVRELLNRGARLDIADKNGCTPIYAAANEGHVEVVRELRNRGARMDITNKVGWIPIYAAAKKGHVEVVRELLNRGTRKNNKDIYGCTPIYAAAEEGHVEVVRELLNRGARMDNKNVFGCTPMYAAAINGHMEVVRELLNRGAIMDTANEDVRELIGAAAQKGKGEVVRELLNCYARMEVENKDFWKPIYAAVKEGNTDVFRELLSCVKIDIEGEFAWTLIYIAAIHGHVGVVRALLNCGVKTDITNDNGCTPVYAAAEAGHVEVVRELVKRGARMDIENTFGWTPIYAAAQEGHVEVVRELLKRGARMDIEDRLGRTPTYVAARAGHVEVFRELLNRGARLDNKNKYSCTPIYAAAEEGHLKVVQELLNRYGKMDIDNEFGWTLIYIAAAKGHVEVVQELLNRGARMDNSSEDGHTPIDAAAEEGHIEVVRELLNRGARLLGARRPEYVASQSGHIEVVRDDSV